MIRHCLPSGGSGLLAEVLVLCAKRPWCVFAVVAVLLPINIHCFPQSNCSTAVVAAAVSATATATATAACATTRS